MRFKATFSESNQNIKASFDEVQTRGGGANVIVDANVSESSKNPVQNQAITKYVNQQIQQSNGLAAAAGQTAQQANQKAENAIKEVTEHKTDEKAHNDIRISITELAKRLNALADSEDIELDQLSEIVAYIKSNKELIDSITTSKVNVVDIIDNLTTNISNKPLSAKQGLELKKLIDALTKVVDGKQDPITVDNAMSNTSENPVQNKVISEYLASIQYNLQGGISNAWNIAKEANTKAETAQETADTAVQKADTAQGKADSAYTLANGAGSVASGAKTTAEEALAKGNALEKSKQDKLSDEQIESINDIPNIKKDYAKTEDVNGKVAEHNTSDESHNDIRLLIQGLTNRLNAIADSEDVDLDQLSEVVAYIKNNKDLIDGITTSKVNVADIVDNLTTNLGNRPLSAKQGVILKGLIDAIVIPTLLSQLGQDASHRLVTDAEKQTWNNKSDFGGKFSDLTSKPTTLGGYGITDGATKTDLNNLSDEVDGKQPKGNYALKSEIPTKTSQLDNDSGFLTAIPDKYVTDDELNAKGYLTEHQDLSDYAKKAETEENLSTHNASDKSHSDIRILVQGLTDRLNALANSDDTTLDQLSEIVDYIKNNKSLIDSITTSKVSVSDIVDNLTSSVSNKPLSAKQGVALKALIDAIVVPTKVSQLENDSKFLTSVPSGYAKTTDHYTKTESDGKYQPKGNYLTIDTLPKYSGEVS